jgi:hypothetical protein
MEWRRDFVVEGLIQIGPRAEYFAFVDGQFLGLMLAQHAGVKSKLGEYTQLGRARITVEWLEDGETIEEASPT